jgi:osmotically-inducible protein OsmY
MKFKQLLSFFVLFAMTLGIAVAQKTTISDDALIDFVRLKLASDPVVKGGSLEVGAKDGIVTLRGKVEENKQKERATKLAKKVKGVKNVDNQLLVVGKGNR